MTYQANLPSRSESTSIAITAATRGPWTIAAAGGAVAGLSDLGVHLLGGDLTVAGPLAFGLVVFFLIGGAGALLRKGRDRTQAWAVDHPWSYAFVPAAGTAVTVFAAKLFLGGSGFFAGVFGGLWNAVTVLLIVGLVGYVARAVRPGR